METGPVEVGRVEGGAPVADRRLVVLADQARDPLARLVVLDVHRDAGVLQLLLQHLRRLDLRRHLRLAVEGERQILHPGLGQQRLGLLVVRSALPGVHTGVEWVVRVDGLGRRDGLAEEGHLDDLVAVDRPGDGLAHPLVVERGLAGVEVDEVRQVGRADRGLDVATRTASSPRPSAAESASPIAARRSADPVRRTVSSAMALKMT